MGGYAAVALIGITDAMIAGGPRMRLPTSDSFRANARGREYGGNGARWAGRLFSPKTLASLGVDSQVAYDSMGNLQIQFANVEDGIKEFLGAGRLGQSQKQSYLPTPERDRSGECGASVVLRQAARDAAPSIRRATERR